jgi:hypothetical protein
MSNKLNKNLQLLFKMKQKNKKFYYNLIDDISSINDINTSSNININIKNLIDDYINDISSIKEMVKQYIIDIDKLICNTCIHEIEEDDIDIGESSKRIKYCKICESTLE